MEAFPIASEEDVDVGRRLTADEIGSRVRRIDGILPRLREMQSSCELCPRHCGAGRADNQLGECDLSADLQVASVALHKGEEPPVSGENGAVNVFFSGCNLHCRYCQNWPVSQQRVGRVLTAADLAKRIIRKADGGAQALGWVTPTPQIVAALEAYRHCLCAGLDLPLVHNNGGYENPEVVRQLSGIVDIWLPDAKTRSVDLGMKISDVSEYPKWNHEAISAMVEQVRSREARAVIVRHLVLPGFLEDSRKVLQNLWSDFGDSIYISLMVQYFPFYKAAADPLMNRRLTEAEYSRITNFARQLGFKKGWVQLYDNETGISPDCLP